jgi:phosphatidylglycerophosphate synthase
LPGFPISAIPRDTRDFPATNYGSGLLSRFVACARPSSLPQWRQSEAVVIKTATVMALGWRFLRSNRRAAAAVFVSQGVVWGRLQAKRVHSRWRLGLPAALVSFRAALGPGIIVVTLLRPSGWALTACIGLALLSDVLDGVLARRWRIDTENLRRWDTRADTLFYACVLVAALLRYPAVIERRWLLIAGLLTAEVATHVMAIMKFGRHASYHSVLSKIWGLLLASSMIGLLGFGLDNWLLDLSIAWGIFCNLQGLAMTLLLPVWQRDVPTLLHAVRLRRQFNHESSARRSFAPSRAWW